MSTHPQRLRQIELGEITDTGVKYRLKAAPKNRLKPGDTRTATVQVLPRGTIREAELVGKIVQETRSDPGFVKYLIEKMMHVIVSELRAGYNVSIDGCFMFGVSIPGRISPQHPEAVNRMKLVPTLRFSPPFHRALNKSAETQYASRYQPTEVRVAELLHWGSACRATGYFHNLQTLKVEMLIGDAVLPCRFELRKDAASTRDIGKTLDIIPLKLPPPPGPRRVRFTYLESTGETQTFVVDAIDTGI